MQTRKLGNSGIDVSVVGFGAWAIGGWMWGGSDDRKAIEAIHAALDAGVNLIDTAPAYGFGHSERLIGEAIRGRRDKVVLATKCGIIWDRAEGEFFFEADEKGRASGPGAKKIYRCLRPASIRNELEQSLRNLQTDCIDLYQTHWQDSTTPIAETMAELERLKAAGKIRAIGVSNCTTDHLAAYGDIQSDQEPFSLIDRRIEQGGSLDFCRRKGIAVLAYSPLSNGLLTGKIAPNRQFGPGDLRGGNPRFQPDKLAAVNAALARLQPIADAHGATIAQLIIARTCLVPGITCALCGARNAKQAIENAAAADIALNATETAAIDAAAQECAAIVS